MTVCLPLRWPQMAWGGRGGEEVTITLSAPYPCNIKKKKQRWSSERNVFLWYSSVQFLYFLPDTGYFQGQHTSARSLLSNSCAPDLVGANKASAFVPSQAIKQLRKLLKFKHNLTYLLFIMVFNNTV